MWPTDLRWSGTECDPQTFGRVAQNVTHRPSMEWHRMWPTDLWWCGTECDPQTDLWWSGTEYDPQIFGGVAQNVTHRPLVEWHRMWPTDFRWSGTECDPQTFGGGTGWRTGLRSKQNSHKFLSPTPRTNDSVKRTKDALYCTGQSSLNEDLWILCSAQSSHHALDRCTPNPPESYENTSYSRTNSIILEQLEQVKRSNQTVWSTPARDSNSAK